MLKKAHRFVVSSKNVIYVNPLKKTHKLNEQKYICITQHHWKTRRAPTILLQNFFHYWFLALGQLWNSFFLVFWLLLEERGKVYSLLFFYWKNCQLLRYLLIKSRALPSYSLWLFLWCNLSVTFYCLQ